MPEHASTPSSADALERLAEAHGISTHYANQRGERMEPPADTFARVLVGMRVIDDVDAPVEALWSALERDVERRWGRALPPVRVLYEGEASGIEFVVAEDARHERWAWSVETETGDVLDGEVEPAALHMAGHEGGGVGDSRYRLGDRALELRWLELPSLPMGYHRLRLRPVGNALDDPLDDDEATSPDGREARLIVAPRRCHLPPGGAESSRVWGLALQLYALRSASNWGIGDFGDLAAAVRVSGELGANAVGVNPLHALFAHEPEQASPYSPSSRLFLNPMYIDVEALPEFSAIELARTAGEERALPKDFRTRLESLRAAEFIDYTAVAELKQAAFEDLYAAFLVGDGDEAAARHEAFASWRREAGEPLARFALFETLRERNFGDESVPTQAWQQWPEAWRRPESDEVGDIARESRERVDFHAWLQWLAATQLDAAAGCARDAGLSVGLYRDLAVGIAGGGSDAWSDQALYVADMHVGAPPDDFSAHGQDWGLPPLDPRALAEAGYAPFADMLRDNMHAAGAIRIDHVMGLMRLFWIPAGAAPKDGAYVDYPIDDMLAVLALESHRAKCIVIGEDLGTVPTGLRGKLRDAAVLSYRLMYFEKHYDGDQSFRLPDEYPAMALVGADTHDLPTLRSFWQAFDLETRRGLDLFPTPEMHAEQLEERGADKRRLLEALERCRLLPAGAVPGDSDATDMDTALVSAVHGMLSRSSSMLLLANVEDLVGQLEQMNLPGTDRDVYPNWRRRLSVAVEDWAREPGIVAAAEAMNRERD